ncbi:MAG: Gx transporter family protein [Fastidiosipilaceae bacterium]|jgi:heptaprenyl diphosphate synthase|nr:Gx transporter family protein [Clostridiaceae bacterium]
MEANSKRDIQINNNRNPRHSIASRVAYTGMLFAIALVLQVVEYMLPPLPVPAPIKLGLSNIVVMYCVAFLSRRETFILVILKGFFALIMRGLLAGGLSLFGGLLSVAVMMLLDRIFKNKVSWLVLSVTGANFHNIGQLVVLLIFLPVGTIMTMLPVLLIFGTLTGALSAVLLNATIPVLAKIRRTSV